MELLEMRKITTVAILSALAAFSNADLLYSNTSQTGFRYGPAANLITFDDVAIDQSLMAGQPNVQVQSIGVGIRRLANAAATDVTIFTAAFDTNLNLIAGSITNLGTTSLAANGATAATTVVTANVGAPYEVPLVFGSGFGFMAVGVQLSSAAGNGWRITNNTSIPGFGSASLATNVSGAAPNLNVAWSLDTSTNTIGAFSFGFNGTNQGTNPPASFYSVVNGAPVPEPGTIFALAGGLALIGIRRRNRK